MTEKKLSPANEDYINKKIIYCALLLQEFGYRELINSPTTVRQEKHFCKTKFNNVRNQLLQIERAASSTKEQIIHSEDLAMDNVSLMASIIGTLAVVPACQVDFIEEEITKICLQAIKNFTDKHEKQNTETSS